MTVRAWIRLACVYLTLAVIAAPAALGAAMGPVLRQLGANTQEHVCKCGMPQGQCGCPECALLELERRAGEVPEAVRTLKRHCDDGTSPVPFAAVAVALVPAGLRVLPAIPLDARTRFLPCNGPVSPDLERSTPPPRLASV
ncbi:MAG TPA: hypothetical protein VF765_16275 [Polyangiaceae bacterium]